MAKRKRIILRLLHRGPASGRPEFAGVIRSSDPCCCGIKLAQIGHVLAHANIVRLIPVGSAPEVFFVFEHSKRRAAELVNFAGIRIAADSMSDDSSAPGMAAT